MADTRAQSGLTPQQWDDNFFEEYVAEAPFSILWGEGENAPIQVKTDLTKKQGDSVTFALVRKLNGDATTGDDVLEGHEEAVDSRSQRVFVDQRRHAVRVSVMEEQKSAIGLRNAGKSMLKTWTEEDTRDRIIAALHSKNGKAYGSASEAEKDAWLADNADRALFGAAKANNSGNDHSASLANIDGTTDVLKRGSISLMKRMAGLANPKIRPIRDPGNGKRVYVAYAHPFTFRDLRADMEGVLDDTTAAGEALRLFEGGDLLWDNIIIKELEEMPLLTGVGASNIDVAPVFFVGAQCIGNAVASRWSTKTRDFDYGNKHGIAMAAIDGWEKLRFGTGENDTDDTKDAGLLTGYFAAVAD
ncbi:phage capsid family protein [Brevundimonas diminuta]|uniref:phage capsid family protein n=1 Tax=Brevundimonas diminuta TaxID=293 RepID=UPI0025A4F9DA|nr:DUF4043 family protein [Brevundimonas diminuta]MDM8352894.1 DUF4043 family protein [Brevundimonas diminuta]